MAIASSSLDRPVTRRPSPSTTRPQPIAPAAIFAGLGAVFLAVQAWAFVGWIASGEAKRTPRGPTPVPDWMEFGVRALEVVSVVGLGVFLYFVMLRPWRRQGRITLDGLFCLAFASLFWQDTFLNAFQPWLTWNATFFNLGNWDSHVPGWLSPGANLVAKPLFFYPIYVWGLFGGVILGNLVMRKAQARWPAISRGQLLALTFGFFCLFGLVEPIILALGIWSYPGAIEWLTIFGGKYYQYPLYEMPLFAGLMTTFACLRYFRNDQGETLAERGIDGLRASRASRTGVRFLALAGACNGILFVVYAIPAAIAGLYASPWPDDVLKRSYLTNGLCGPGTEFSCPGPGTPIPRPDSSHLDPNGELVRPGR